MERVQVLVAIVGAFVGSHALGVTALLTAGAIANTFALLRLSDEDSESRICRWLASIGYLKTMPAYFALSVFLTIFWDAAWKASVSEFGRVPLWVFAALMVFTIMQFLWLTVGFTIAEGIPLRREEQPCDGIRQ